MSSRTVTLKTGKERSLNQRHPWIFSGAIAQIPQDCQPGELLPVHSHDGNFLALAYFQPNNSLAGRVLSFKDRPIADILRKKISGALEARKFFFSPLTTAYRLINAEGDGLPGLIIDQYGQVLVIQITTAGMERFKSLIIEILVELLAPKAIYEKSHGPARYQEGLEDAEGFLWGSCEEIVEIRENGLKFSVSLKEGQKTGFFLDQREMRKWVREHSKGKKVLNGFAYTGGFSVAAFAGDAELVHSVEISKKVEPILKCNLELNGFSQQQHQFFAEDVFDFLSKSPLDYDLIILDPPAFAKKRSDVDAACRGYKQLMLQVFHKAKPGTLLLFSSCSHYVDAHLLQTLAFQAALEANRNVWLFSRHIQAFDHPISLFHPEGEYLKSLILHIS